MIKLNQILNSINNKLYFLNVLKKINSTTEIIVYENLNRYSIQYYFIIFNVQ